MKYISFILLLLSLAGCDSSTTPPFDYEKTYMLDYVKDGDTISFNDIGTIRLSAIDTPEVYSGNRMNHQADECSNGDTSIIKEMGEQSSKFVKSFVKKGESYIVLSYGEDIYSRTLGQIFLKNGKSLNLKIVEEGYALPYIFSEDINSTKVFNALEQAKKNKRGLWLNYKDEMECIEKLDQR